MGGWLKPLRILSNPPPPRMLILAAIVHLGWARSFTPITEPHVHEAQADWAAAIIEIGAQPTPQDSKVMAENYTVILYACNTTGVVFKPTLARDPQFRDTFTGALSYFVGQDPNFPQDTGFALDAWINITFMNVKIILLEDVAVAGGLYYFENAEGDYTIADYTFLHTQVNNDTHKTSAQHSSLPYSNDALLCKS